MTQIGRACARPFFLGRRGKSASAVHADRPERHLHHAGRERFFIIGGQWIAVMENPEIVNRTYHHVAFKIREEDIGVYQEKIRALGLEMKPPRPRIKGEGLSIYFYDYDNNLFELHTGTLEERLAAYREADGG